MFRWFSWPGAHCCAAVAGCATSLAAGNRLPGEVESRPQKYSWPLARRAQHRRVYAALRCDAAAPREAKLFGVERGFDELREKLLALPAAERRAALSLLGLATGDAAGVPFELRRGAQARAAFRAAALDEERMELAKTFVHRRAARLAGESPDSIFIRTFSDDTTCCDLKMEAVAQAGRYGAAVDADSLQQAVLQQYLTWAHGAKTCEGVGKAGELFQGTGGFTQDFLVPYFRGKNNEVARIFGQRSFYEDDAEMGPFWPTAEFTEFASKYFKGEYSFPSWGNGAVMSFAPQPVLAGRWRVSTPSSGRAPSAALESVAEVLGRSHQEPSSKLGGELLWELLDAVYSGGVSSTGDLRKSVCGLQKYLDVAVLSHDCIPVAAFKEWAECGDCSPQTAEAFLRRLTRSRETFDLEPGKYGVFGKMLHIAADWNDDHRTYLKRANSEEPVLFSQRGLNSVIIAIWAASGASSPWEAISRVIYVGGDTDTVGAVCGQIAFPLMDPEDAVEAFIDFVALGRTVGEGPLSVVNAAARRYFRRALLFATGDLEELRRCPSLLDPEYPGVTDAVVLRRSSTSRL